MNLTALRTFLRLTPTWLFVTLATFAANDPAAAYVPVFGGPTYSTATSTGYTNPEQHFGAGSPVNNSGVAVGWVTKFDSGANLATRGVRWDGSGAPAAELGNLGTNAAGVTESRAYALNDSGIAVGYAVKYNANVDLGYWAVRWDASGTSAIELGLLGTDFNGHTLSAAYDVSDTGIAVGFANKYVAGGNFGARAVRWDATGAPTELDHLGTGESGYTFSFANAVNASGTAVGFADKILENSADLGRRAVRWEAGGSAATELGHLGTESNGNTGADAFAVNDSGTAVGYADKHVAGIFQGQRAVRWDAVSTEATELESLGTDSNSNVYAAAFAVNASGTAVGYSNKEEAGFSYGQRAVRWDATGTTATELGNLGTDDFGTTFAVARSINSAGHTVGAANVYVDGSLNGGRAVLWKSDAVAIDLNSLIDPASGWLLTDAYGISDTGWISGIGRFDPDGPGGDVARERLFVMQVPEPSSALLLSLAASAIGFFRPRLAQLWFRPTQ